MSISRWLETKKRFLTYCFYGFLATLFETGLYSFFYIKLSLPNIAATVMSWILTVIFAFFTNKLFVYRSREWKVKLLFKEIVGFFSCRFSTGVFNCCWMILFVDWIGFNGVIMKILAAFIVGILNYTIALLLIFKEGKNQQMENLEP